MVFRDSRDEVQSGTFSGGGSGGKGGPGLAVGGIGGIVILLLSAYFGVDINKVTGGLTSPAQQSDNTAFTQEIDKEIAACKNGNTINAQKAQNSIVCTIYVADSSAYSVWATPHPDKGWTPQDAQLYAKHVPSIKIFEGSVNTACGPATADVGPFYCPGDQTAYFDPSFFTTMLKHLNASTGTLAKMYVVEHEIGHHVQNLLGYEVQDRKTGQTSDSVRMELQADCFAGFWASEADKGDNPAIQPVTQEEIQEVIQTTEAIGDNTLQSRSGRVNPEQWTHGSSEQRSKWFMTGYKGQFNQCDTWNRNVNL